jgi:hypothetical protein
VWQLASRAERSSDLEKTGPTAWITHFAGRLPAEVATAFPVGSPSGWVVRRISRHSSRMAPPPFRWMAPSTPPPPKSEELAAFTTASTRSSVMSPRTSSILGTCAS